MGLAGCQPSFSFSDRRTLSREDKAESDVVTHLMAFSGLLEQRPPAFTHVCTHFVLKEGKEVTN